jgi:uncharacterized protein YukE
MLVKYMTPQIADASTQIANASEMTEQNRQRSLQIVTANAENFGGQGSDAFQMVIAQVNHRYAESQQAIQRAGVALGMANDGMTEGDQQSKSQYL